MSHATRDEARAVLAAAIETRRAKPALKVPLAARGLRPLDTNTSSGLLIAVLVCGATIGVYFGLKGGAVGWILGAVCAVGAVLGATKGLASVPHDIRVTRRFLRVTRVTKRLTKAMERSEPGAGDPQRAKAFREAIIDGSLKSAAMGILGLFRELEGDDALSEELIHKRTPVWPAWLYFQAFQADLNRDEARAEELLEQARATGDQVWATAATVGLLDHLKNPTDRERAEALNEWLLRYGDPAVVTELVYYR